jgi:hypothetical protein
VKLVIDARVAVAASATPVGFTRFRDIELVAPPRLWIEVVFRAPRRDVAP